MHLPQSHIFNNRLVYLSFTQVICAVMAVFNTLLFIYLFLAGGKIVTLFTVMLPLQLVMLIGHSWWIFLLIPTTSVILYYIFCQFPSADKNVNQKRNYIIKCCRTPCKSIVLGFLILLGLHSTAALMLKWVVHNGCLACDSTPNQEIPKKPYLIAHRGCSFLFPENTLAAFREAVKLPNVEGIETDVQISLDGVPFLLHDPHLIRTTDARSRCPTINPHNNATWLNFSSGSCPLQEIDVGVWFDKVGVYFTLLFMLSTSISLPLAEIQGSKVADALGVSRGCQKFWQDCDI